MMATATKSQLKELKMLLSDGQHKYSSERRSCFFCTKTKNNCQLFSLNPDVNLPEYSSLYNQRFVICPECSAKGTQYLAEHLLHWIKVQDELKLYGVGLPDVERHKQHGTLPKLKKRKKR